jgi:hypothetical protein
MKLKEIWSKLSSAIKVQEPVNTMTAQDVIFIQKKVREQTAFDVNCMDTRTINGRKNVGLIIPETAGSYDIAKAQDVFIAAAKERGIAIERQNIVRYAPTQAESLYIAAKQNAQSQERHRLLRN